MNDKLWDSRCRRVEVVKDVSRGPIPCTGRGLAGLRLRNNRDLLELVFREVSTGSCC